MPGHTTEQEGVGQAVSHRVEVGATGGGCPAGLGHGTIQRIRHAGQHQQEEAEPQVAHTDSHRGTTRHEDPDNGDHVGRDTGPLKALADGDESSIDHLAPIAVQHGGCSRRTRRVPHQVRLPEQLADLASAL